MFVPFAKKTKTDEEKRAIVEKSIATRKRNKEAREKANKNILEKQNIIYNLETKIKTLESKLALLEAVGAIGLVSSGLPAQRLLMEIEIVKAATPWEEVCGIYFLVEGNEIVYIGQSVNVYNRVTVHKEKKFSRCAYVECSHDNLDLMESLYIHFFRPKLNGVQGNGLMCAPIPASELMDVLNRGNNERPKNQERMKMKYGNWKGKGAV
jgi:hypothetical protein